MIYTLNKLTIRKAMHLHAEAMLLQRKVMLLTLKSNASGEKSAIKLKTTENLRISR